jgi:hypothetical protein
MEEHENRRPASENGMVAPKTEATSWLEGVDLLVSHLRDLHIGWPLEGLTLEQRAALEQIEAALEAYNSFFYPLVTLSRAVRRPESGGTIQAQGSTSPNVVKEEP